MISNYKKNYSQSVKPTRLSQIQFLIEFSFVIAAMVRRISKPAMFAAFLLLQLAAAGTALAQTQQMPVPKVIQTENGEVQVFEAPAIENRSTANDLFKTRKTDNIFSSNVESLLAACTPSPISYGQTVFRSIDQSDCLVNNVYSDEYTFSGTAGQQINIAFGTHQFFGSLQLVSEGGVLVNNLNSAQGRINNFTLPSTGTYTIRLGASSQQFFYPNTIGGNYYLSLSLGSPACTYRTSFIGYTISSGGSTDFVTDNIVSPDGCNWTATSNSPWLTITTGNSGSGNGNFVISVAANNDSAPRRGTITIAGLEYFVYQGTSTPCATSPISYGQTVNGNFQVSDCSSFGAYEKEYTFTGVAGDQITTITSYDRNSNTGIFSTTLRSSQTSIPAVQFFSQEAGVYKTVFNLPTNGVYTIRVRNIRFFDLPGATDPFTLTLEKTYNIKGRVTDEATGNGIQNVQINVAGKLPSILVRTDANGNYTYPGLENGTYTVIPMPQAGRVYTPDSASVVINNNDALSVDFRERTLTVGNSTIIPINPRAAYLRADSDERLADAVPIDLAAMGITPGSNIEIRRLGDFGFFTGCPQCQPPTADAPDTATGMIGVFSSTNVLLPASQLNRVPGAINTGLFPIITGNTLAGNLPTDIPEDFSIDNGSRNSVSFTVPNNVRYLFAAANDPGYPADNIDPDNDFAVQIITYCSYSISPNSANITAAGGSFTFNITTGENCTWSAVSNSSWLTTSSSGTGSGTITYTAAANPNLSSRTGTITVNGQTFTVTQQAFVCTYALSPNASNAPAAGGQFTFNVTTNSSICPVPVTSNADWLSTSTSNNGGTITIVYSVEPNPDMSPRTGTITVGDQTFTVTQAAAVCMYSINPTSASAAFGGGNGSFTITTTPGCTWSAVSNVNWLTTSSSGTGSGTVNYTVAANNTLSPRTGTITVGGQIFTVTQAAAVCIYSVSPTSQIVEAAAGTYSFTVFASPGCSWTATPLDSWITTTAGGTGNGTVSYTVSANTGAARQGRIRVADQIFTVNQRSPVVTTFSISGRVTNGENGPGLSGIRVTLSGPDSREAITDSDGNYLFNNLAPADYTVTPLLTGAVINPTVSTIPFLDRDRRADFSVAVCSYSVSPSGRNVSAEGTSGSFVVNGCGSIPWQAESNVSWIIVDNEGRGAGTQAVGYFVQRNYGAARSGVIAVNGQLYTIIQDGFTPPANRSGSPQVDSPQCVFKVANPVTNLRRQVVPFTGSNSGSFEVDATNLGNVANCGWKAVTGSSWIKIANNGNGVDDQAVSFTVEENQSDEPRFGTISVDNEVYTIVQTINPGSCSFSLIPPMRNFMARAATGSFSVETPRLCRWTSFIDEEDKFTTNWLKIDGGTNRVEVGPGTKNFTIEANDGPKTNEGTIVVGDKAFTITQDAGKLSDCRWAFAAPGESVLVTGGTDRRINVLTATGCNWTAVSDAEWIQITGGVGTADGTVSFNVTPNQGTTARTGRISIMQNPSVQYTITQAAPETCNYELKPNFQRAENSGTTGTIRVTASNACGNQTITAVSNNPDWITITSVGNGTVDFVVKANLLTVPRSGTITVAGQTYTVNQDAGNITSSLRTNYDFDGDGRADISVFRPSNGVWYLNQSTSGFTGVQFGQDGDKLVAADYDGDGRTDVAVYRAGTWYLNRSTLGFTGVNFGAGTDIPVPGDYDGDGRADLAVWRPSNGVWYVFNLVNNQVTSAQFGAPTDQPVVGDFNGDGKSDFAVFRSSNGFWYIARPTGTPSQNFDSVQLGTTDDKPVPADYDGDGKTDVAVFRPSNGTWYLQRSRDGFTGIQFGFGTDLPAPADYDGDGKADVAVFRNGTWFLQHSTQGFTGVQFGAPTDKPVPNALVP